MEWTEYEELVYQECCRVFDVPVKKNVHIKGQYSERMRQIDVYIPLANIDGDQVPLMIDAKHYNKKIDVKTVESYIAMMDDVNVKHGILVSSKGFTASALKRAHNSPTEIEVEILTVKELERFQSTIGFIYSGISGFLIRTPFCWVVDGQKRNNMLACFYRNEFSSFEEAACSKDFIYINLWHKDYLVKSISDLLEKQKQEYDSLYEHYEINIKQHKTGVIIRYFKQEVYPMPEITVFKEYDDCILFGVMFTSEIKIKRDLKKLIFLLNSAVPVKFNNDDFCKRY